MDAKTAASRLNLLFSDASNEDYAFTEVFAEAVQEGIQALEEIQQYRAIGMVEELQSMKENGSFTGVELAQIAAMQMQLKKYQEIGTVEEFKALKEKAAPKICNMSGDGYADGHLVYDTYQCPNCGKEYELEYEEYEYCPECGQHMSIKYEQEE